MPRRRDLAATIERFDSFWEAPDDIAEGYRSFGLFCLDNYRKYFPTDKRANILCVSCGSGYGVRLLTGLGYDRVLGIDSFESMIAFARAKKLSCRLAYAFEVLEDAADEAYDLIWIEQEINHLTRLEILEFLSLSGRKLRRGGLPITFALNGASPYVFYKNPFNYVAMAAAAGLSRLFRACFLLYGKRNRLFGKKIASTCLRPEQ